MRVHFMGIKGSGAAGVADLASKMGYEVNGCDISTGGHDVSHLQGVDLLVVTPAVFWQSAKHPEFLEGQKRGIVITWQEFLGKILLKNKKVIAVAGTHGKSTTTAMTAKLLVDNGFDPVCVIGAYVPEWGGNSRFGKGEYAVVEADEFNDNFLNYSPEIAIITNIEFDHPDYFENEAQLRKSFEMFKASLVGSKILITERDSLGKRFNLKIWGEHNQKNANLVYVLGQKLGIKSKEIVKSLESFAGIGRRMEFLGKTKSGAVVYDDYAHHPTAIRVTLEGLREKFPKAKILSIIEAHGFKRTKALLAKYKGAFAASDKVIIGPIFKARDTKTYDMTPEKIAQASRHPDVKTAKNLKEITDHCSLITDHYDVIIVMGAGRSNLWARKLLEI